MNVRLLHTAEYATAAAAVAACAAVCLAFVLPLAAALVPLAGSKDAYSFDITRIIGITAYTLKIALGSTLVAVAVGIPAAFFTANRNFPGRRFLLSLSAVPLSIPPLIIALGFVSIFGMHGILNIVLMKMFGLKEPPLTFLYTTCGVIIAQGFYNFPIIMSVVSSAWEQLPRDEREAALILGAGPLRVFRTVTLPQLSGPLAAACIPVFLYSLFSFMIVLLFGNIGGTTFEVEIYQAARTTLDFKTASLLALVETSIALILIAVYCRFSPADITGNSEIPSFCTRTKIGQGSYGTKASRIAECAGAAVLLVVICFFFLLPLAGIATGCLSGKEGFGVFIRLFASQGFAHAVFGTALTAPLAALLCVVTAFVFAALFRLHAPMVRSAAARTVPMLPMALSSVVTGYGMTFLVRQGNIFTLALAQATLAWPLAFSQIYASLCAIPQDTIDASRLLSPSEPDIVFRIMVPGAQRSICAAFGFCFAVSAGDTTLPLVLSVPRFDTLALYTYRLASSYRFAASCACGIILCIICTALFAAGRKKS